MADIKYTPTAGEQQMLGDFNNRMADLDRIAQTANPGLAILPDPNQPQPVTAQSLAGMSQDERDNAEKTARWGLQDIASQAKYATSREDKAGALAALNRGYDSYTKFFGDRPMRFADGGKPESAEELMARINAKYGVASAAAPAVQAAPTPAPRPQAQPAQQPGSLIQSAAGLLRDRGRQIDRAVNGYAQGGELNDEQLAEASPLDLEKRRIIQHRAKRRAGIKDSVTRLGGKIKGPGTPTSDSIPAKVSETDADILVSTDERILSKKQDDLLLRIAKAMGFDSVDQFLEVGTGEPVGPTIKGRKIAAAGGLQPGQTVDDGAGGVYTPEAGFNPGQAVGNLLKDSAQAARSGVDYNQVRQNRIQQETAPHPYGNEGRSVPAPITEASRHPISVPANRAAAAQPVDNTPAQPLRTTDILPGGYLDRGAGILAQRSGNGKLNVTNVDTGSLTDSSKRAIDDSASALIDQKNSTYNPQRQLENMQRLRLQSDLTNPEIRDPAVRAEAAKGLLILNAGRQGEAQAIGQAAQAKLHNAQAMSAEQTLGLHREYLDPATTPERRTELHGIIRALSGKERDPVNLQAIDVEEPIDARQPLLGNKKIPYVFDPRSGNSRPMLQQQATDPHSQARAAIARGADPKAVNARLKAMGLPEVK